MSRIGRMLIQIPKGVEVKLERDFVSVKGPKGELKRRVHPKVQVNVSDEEIVVSSTDSSGVSRSLNGLFRALIFNMVNGVSNGFERVLEVVGVGYRAELKGRTAIFNLGYSLPIEFKLPDGIDIKIEKSTIRLSGIDKELVGMTAAKIRSLRKPEPYKGKGIRYAEERIRRKAGKAGAKQ